MLDEKDLQAIRGIVKEEVKSEVNTAIEGNNVRIFETIEGTKNTILCKMDEKFAEQEKNIMVTVGTIIEEGNKNVIHAVGEMLEDNVFPQFAEVHRELRRMNIIVGWQR